MTELTNGESDKQVQQAVSLFVGVTDCNGEVYTARDLSSPEK